MPRRFVIHSPMRDLDMFRQLAEQACLLKTHGEVAVNISTLAEKSRHEIPDGGSPWHEYAGLNPTLFKFFPHPDIAPHIPPDHVARNRDLLLAKADILKEYGLKAGFWAYDPNFLPESFFEDHPQLRGARVDHPRRSKEEAFAPCVDQPAVQDMYAWMMKELAVQVPELVVYSFKTNDAGTGLCWSENLYTGPNGPHECRHITVGERTRSFLEALHRGAGEGGVEIETYMSGYITDNELDRIALHLPPNAFLDARTDAAMTINSLINTTYPVVGLCNPLGLLSNMERLQDKRIKTVFMGFRAMYDRGYDTLETTARTIELTDACLKTPVKGLRQRQDMLYRMCEQWGGAEEAEPLYEAFSAIHEALRMKAAGAGRLETYSGGVTQRWITRPLLIKPDLLPPEDEAYFMPYIFNIHEEEARQDYIDLAGGRMVPGGMPPARPDPRLPAIDMVVSLLRRAAQRLEPCPDAPETAWLQETARAIRLWTNLLRTSNHFYGAQIIRDRRAEALDGPPVRPSKEPTWTGDEHLLAFNEIRRDEFDNTHELINMLEEYGLDLIVTARDTADADPFQLEPELPGHLRRKIEIMRAHWLDGERYLTPPFK